MIRLCLAWRFVCLAICVRNSKHGESAVIQSTVLQLSYEMIRIQLYTDLQMLDTFLESRLVEMATITNQFGDAPMDPIKFHRRSGAKARLLEEICLLDPR